MYTLSYSITTDVVTSSGDPIFTEVVTVVSPLVTSGFGAEYALGDATIAVCSAAGSDGERKKSCRKPPK